MTIKREDAEKLYIDLRLEQIRKGRTLHVEVAALNDQALGERLEELELHVRGLQQLLLRLRTRVGRVTSAGLERIARVGK